MTLTGHTDKISCVIQLADLRLASSSKDKTIRIWNLISGKCELVLEGHTDYVFNICQLKATSSLTPGNLASGSFDKSIKIWNLVSGACLMTLVDHARTVRCVLQVIYTLCNFKYRSLIYFFFLFFFFFRCVLCSWMMVGSQVPRMTALSVCGILKRVWLRYRWMLQAKSTVSAVRHLGIYVVPWLTAPSSIGC